jgi:hypothetical protein
MPWLENITQPLSPTDPRLAGIGFPEENFVINEFDRVEIRNSQVAGDAVGNEIYGHFSFDARPS